jgi:hypothetical protein
MQRHAGRYMTLPLIQKDSLGIERLPADFAGFCCEDRNCPECLRAYRKGLAFMRQERAARRKLRQSLPDGATRKPRKPSLTHIAAQAKKAGIDVARIEVAADGSYIVVSKDEHQQGNEVDQWIANHARALERH